MVERAIAYQEAGSPPLLPVPNGTAGLATPAVLTQIEEAVQQGTGLWDTLKGLLNPRELEAQRAAEVARRAAEDALLIPAVVPAGIAVGPAIPLVLAGLAALLLFSSRR